MTLERGRWTISIVASVAVCLGLAVQHQLGAPASGLMVQAAGACLGAILFFLLSHAHPPQRAAVVVIGLVSLIGVASPLAFGPESAGARRWLPLGPVSVQPSMVLLPLVIWLSARQSSWAISLLVLATGGVLALQFDAAALSGLALAWLASLARSARRGEAHAWGAAVGLFILTAWAWMRPDALPSVAWVEQVLPNAWGHGLWTGAMATLAVILVLAPLVLLARGGQAALGLAAFYAGLVGAALVGNYPLPVVGLGASLVVGWLMALGLARAPTRSSPPP
ncbi:FtsW/RodA/SpoVE family cell cycle protein [Brevundimonas sp.]|uniref:FtsW/RodA/SpoVE family cell cycle protein n=1 Tax=Brevundimonas sp. TaxID=1871086 RepID=UPI00391CA760